MTAFTEVQIAAIGGVVQGMLDKALRSKDRPSEGDESGEWRRRKRRDR